jgi:1-acyl-sn-glycerol-3-phosphate acyltransferase
MIRAVFVTLATFAYIFIVGTPFFIHAVLIGSTDTLYKVAGWGAGLVLWLAGARLDVRHRNKIPHGTAVVFMPNHQSNCDGPAMFVTLPPILVLAKQEFFKVPLLGSAMRLRGFIPVDRRNRQAAIESVERAVTALKKGNSFLAFPEGTRTRDGRLQRFKKGIFVMAIKAGAPIVPISISGSFKIMRKGKWAMYPGRVRITLHDPIPTGNLSLDDLDQVSQRVRAAIISGLDADEIPLEAEAAATAV